MNTILTMDHAIYVALGCTLEFFGAWACARIKTLAKAPTATLSADAIALVEKLVDTHLAHVASAIETASAVQKVAALTAATAPAVANTNTTPST